MKKQLAAHFRSKGWVVRKAPLFVEKFLWFKHFYLPPIFSDELIFISPKGGSLTEEGAWNKVIRKFKKRMAKMEQYSEVEFELLEYGS